MKKSLLSLFLASALLLTAIPQHAEAATKSYEVNDLPVTIHIDERYLPTDMNPIIEKNHTLVPIRAIAEALGAEVIWYENNREVHVRGNGKDLGFVIGQNIYTLNGNNRKAGTAIKVVNGRTLVPLRIVGETFATKVDWNSNTKDINIRTDAPRAGVQVPPTVHNDNVQGLIDKFYVQALDGDSIVGNWQLRKKSEDTWLAISDIGDGLYEMILISYNTKNAVPMTVARSTLGAYRPASTDYQFDHEQFIYYKGPAMEFAGGYSGIFSLRYNGTLVFDQCTVGGKTYTMNDVFTRY